jgi:ATP-dependent Clp protease ATP-binding subunit ClpA
VKEPSVEDTIEILKGIKANYETHHHIEITEEALVASAKLADRYISNKFLPDKAIDLLDETAAAKRLTMKEVDPVDNNVESLDMVHGILPIMGNNLRFQ